MTYLNTSSFYFSSQFPAVRLYYHRISTQLPFKKKIRSPVWLLIRSKIRLNESIFVNDHICLKNIWITKLAYLNIIYGIKYCPLSWYTGIHGHSTYNSKIYKACRVKRESQPGTIISCALHTSHARVGIFILFCSPLLPSSLGNEDLWEINLSLQGRLQVRDQEML